MSHENTVLLIGLDPAVVNYSKWPGLTREKLEGGLRSDENKLNEAGYGTSICFVDRGETAEEVVDMVLAENSYDCIIIGAGIRADPDEFLLFEKLINAVHKGAPGASICFNTGPTDTFEAVQRWA